MILTTQGKYATPEEARIANLERTKEWNREHKEQYNAYQREYQKEVQRKMREQKKLLNDPVFQTCHQVMSNPQLYQQFISYVQILNDPTSYQRFVNYLNSNPTPVVLEIVPHQ